ncbi:MAG: dipeptide/oligopeptide/nickel ABC transporter permease/ATP-binding protein [Streptosporangiaceae bacterium]|jgi:peptide/nickel transport system permease protein
MTTPAATSPEAAPLARRGPVLRRLLRKPVAVACLVILAVLVIASALAPVLTSQSPTTSSLADVFCPASASHPLGCDSAGRDILARLLYGGQVSLLGAFTAVAIALALGISSGLIGGYFRGWLDAVLSWVASLVMATPTIIVLLVVIAAIGSNTEAAMVVLGVLIAPNVFRLVRGSVIAVREELYIDAARVAGLSDARIVRRHILPVVQAPVIIQATQLFGLAIVIQAGIEFLGLGSPGQASWGAMLNDAFTNLYVKPILLLWPGLAIVLTVAALGLLGNSLRDVVSPGDHGLPSRSRQRSHPTRSASGRPDGPEPETGSDDLLVVEDLTVSYPGQGGDSVVVDRVSVSVRCGEVLGLVGESGSGKSQTVFSILGLLPEAACGSASRMSFAGRELGGLSRAAMNELRGRRIGYVPQEPMSNLDPSFTIGSQLTEPIRQHLKLSRAQARRHAIALLDRVGIAEPERVYKSYPHQISGGMAQRVLIAGAVSCEPDLLIADEPTTALDVTVQAEILDLMREMLRERQMGMILVTHNFGVVADICDRVSVMQSGRIVESAPVAELFASPQHAYTRMLLDSTLEDAAPRPRLATPSPFEASGAEGR